MATINELKMELDDVTTLKLISSAFTEASAARVQKIKKEFENNQQFYQEVSELYHLVQVSAKKQMDGSNGKNHPPEVKKGTMISVAVTSNQRFYGNINVNIMTEFWNKSKDNPGTDLLVIGNTGRDFMKSTQVTRKWEHLSFVKEQPSTDEVKNFLEKVKTYEKIAVYYPKFISLVRQDVGVTDITQTMETGKKIEDDSINMIFEPDLSMILHFFSDQVRALLFIRVMLETDLARTAARLITMSGAEERSNDMMKIKKRELRKLQTSITNAKLLETFAAMSGWKK